MGWLSVDCFEWGLGLGLRPSEKGCLKMIGCRIQVSDLLCTRRRHSRAGGNLFSASTVAGFGCCLLLFGEDSRLRGNDGDFGVFRRPFDFQVAFEAV